MRFNVGLICRRATISAEPFTFGPVVFCVWKSYASVMSTSAPKLPSSLSDVALAYLKAYEARFDPIARADEEKLRATLAKLKIEPWAALFEIESAEEKKAVKVSFR